ncbi:MAG: HAMP domain-containing sensor histidine kinase [Pseudomonadota bacterium]
MRRTSVFASDVFRRALIASGSFIAVAIALVWVVGSIMIGGIEASEHEALEEAILDIEEHFAEGGIDRVVDEFGEDDIWDDDLIFERLEEEALVYVLRNEEDDVLAGYGGLWPDDSQPLVLLDHPDIGEPLRAQSFGLDDEIWGAVARFVPEREYDWGWLMETMTYALVVVGLPLSLVIAYFLSRSVLARIEAISDTAEAVTSGVLQSRVALSGAGDEFDRLSSKINEMLDKLAQLNRNIEGVTVGVAHDLKTPLANIRGRLELIRRDLTDAKAAEAHVKAAEGYLQGLLRVFDALLRLGEVETGRRRAAFAELDLSELAAEMGEAYAPVFEESQKSLSVRVAPGLVVTGDRELLQQLLSNLLENAAEHSRDAAKAFLHLEADQGQIALRVGDDGPGISPADRERLFERFYRSDQSRGSPGNGLGLSLVRAIAELHSADIALLQGTQGAVFEIIFPRADQSYKTV